MIKKFLDDNFLLQSEVAEQLYHEYAAKMPIIDYHNHLPPIDLAQNRQFKTITEAWLEGDHYKWRAMRTNGVDEKYCTGDATDSEKFEKWAETVPYTLRNPLYHWTHLELKRYFNITQLLNPSSFTDIYEAANELLNTDPYRVRGLLAMMKVEVVCTTDDPTDSLEHHAAIQNEGIDLKVLPTFRPDKAILFIDNPKAFNEYMDKLSEVSHIEIASFQNLRDALQKRADFFHTLGCRLSDHGLEEIYAEDYTEVDLQNIFQKVRAGNPATPLESLKFKSGMLIHLGQVYHSKGWVQQFHLGALRNNSTRMMRQLGPDTGFDSMGDFSYARTLAKFLNRLDTHNQLSKTIIYNLNPSDNELIATMVGNFNDGSVPGKIQFGSGWWFNDQKEGMEWQMNALSNMGLLSRFVGMLTDSRSFLSFPRHEYFRRILCNLLGNDVVHGELPADLDLLGQVVEDICYHNAKNYFNF